MRKDNCTLSRMTLAALTFLGAGLGALTAISGRAELVASPRSVFLTRTHGLFLIFAFSVFLPCAAYFYIFHGDWFVSYAFDTRATPSALALIAGLFLVVIASAGFGLGGFLARQRRDLLLPTYASLLFLIAVGINVLLGERFSIVATTAQFYDRYGIESFQQSTASTATITLGSLMLATFGLFIGRHWFGLRKYGA